MMILGNLFLITDAYLAAYRRLSPLMFFQKLSMTGIVFNKPSNQSSWTSCEYSSTYEQARAEAIAHYEADCCEPDYEPIDWAIQLDSGEMVVVHTAA